MSMIEELLRSGQRAQRVQPAPTSQYRYRQTSHRVHVETETTVGTSAPQEPESSVSTGIIPILLSTPPKSGYWSRSYALKKAYGRRHAGRSGRTISYMLRLLCQHLSMIASSKAQAGQAFKRCQTGSVLLLRLLGVALDWPTGHLG